MAVARRAPPAAIPGPATVRGLVSSPPPRCRVAAPPAPAPLTRPLPTVTGAGPARRPRRPAARLMSAPETPAAATARPRQTARRAITAAGAAASPRRPAESAAPLPRSAARGFAPMGSVVAWPAVRLARCVAPAACASTFRRAPRPPPARPPPLRKHRLLQRRRELARPRPRFSAAARRARERPSPLPPSAREAAPASAPAR